MRNAVISHDHGADAAGWWDGFVPAADEPASSREPAHCAQATKLSTRASKTRRIRMLPFDIAV
jgi:hypothetical protein